MFKFIHTADIHLDSPLKSLALRDPQIAELVGGASRRTFESIVSLCIEEDVDALIIAGDLYDGDVRSMKTAAFLRAQMSLLDQAGIEVFIIRGNHDYAASITQHLNLPSNVHVFTGAGGVKKFREQGVAIHGVSFTERHVPKSLLGKYKQPIAGLVNIGIMHTSLSGAEGHDVYAPCKVEDLASHGFDYWALGHVHQSCVHADKPLIVMPGIPQGRDIGESGPKSVTLVEIVDGCIQHSSQRRIADTEFQKVHVDLTDVIDWSESLKRLQSVLQEVQSTTKARHLICRVILQGKSSLFWVLQRDSDLFAIEAKEVAKQLNHIFIDGIENQVELLASHKDDAGPIDELEALMVESAKEGIFRGEMLEFLEGAMRDLPSELRDAYGVDQEEKETILQRLLDVGILDVIATLKGGQTVSEVT